MKIKKKREHNENGKGTSRQKRGLKKIKAKSWALLIGDISESCHRRGPVHGIAFYDILFIYLFIYIGNADRGWHENWFVWERTSPKSAIETFETRKWDDLQIFEFSQWAHTTCVCRNENFHRNSHVRQRIRWAVINQKWIKPPVFDSSTVLEKNWKHCGSKFRYITSYNIRIRLKWKYIVRINYYTLNYIMSNKIR